jgi:WD40 repeat protein
VLDVAIDPSGDLIAAACNDGEVRLWRSMAEPSISLPGHGSLPTRSVAFSADGSLLATAGDDGVIRVFDTVSAMIVHAIQPTTSDRRVHSVRFSRQGRRLVAAGNNGSVRIYDLQAASPSPPTR